MVWNTYIWVEDADESAAKAREAGGSVLSEPFEVMDAGRMGCSPTRRDLRSGSGEFWTLSAYGDYLEALTPGTRERAAELGAAGFEDVVAAITPIAGDDADIAQWGVTFSTEDADAMAAKATELGGTVLVGPVDAPYSRLTVLRDPQGATFSVTAFVPENKDIGPDAA